MREVRLALLEADVNFEVVKDFVGRVRERALGADVLKSLTPGQQVVKIVHEELTALMGAGDSRLAFAGRPPTVVLLAGLQGSGKTTAAAKLALLLRNEGRKPVLVTAGRLHVDEDLMQELAAVRDATRPTNVLLVLDSMTGQDAVRVAEAFAERVAFDGILLTKLDGDARGGAALSVKAVTGKPVKLVSVGEKLD